MKRAEAKDLGFKEIGHYTIGNSLIYDLGLNVHLSFSSIGTPNEMLCICQRDFQDEKNITDVVRLHNYDHHGYMTKDKLKDLTIILKQNKP